MKKLSSILLLAFAVGLLSAGCGHLPTLAPGGVYADPVLAQSDQSILDASHALTLFIQWQHSNAAFLSRWPDVADYSASVAAHKDEWIKEAYAARDSYADASRAYKEAVAANAPPAEIDAKEKAAAERHAKLTGAIALLNSVTAQINAYKGAHNG